MQSIARPASAQNYNVTNSVNGPPLRYGSSPALRNGSPPALQALRNDPSAALQALHSNPPSVLQAPHNNSSAALQALRNDSSLALQALRNETAPAFQALRNEFSPLIQAIQNQSSLDQTPNSRLPQSPNSSHCGACDASLDGARLHYFTEWFPRNVSSSSDNSSQVSNATYKASQGLRRRILVESPDERFDQRLPEGYYRVATVNGFLM